MATPVRSDVLNVFDGAVNSYKNHCPAYGDKSMTAVIFLLTYQELKQCHAFTIFYLR